MVESSVLILCSVFAVIPLYDKKNAIFKKSFGYTCLVTLILAIACLYSIYGRIVMEMLSDATDLCLTHLPSLIAMISNLVLIWGAITFNFKKLNSFISKFNNVDRDFEKFHALHVCKGKFVYAELCLALLVIIGLTIFDLVMCLELAVPFHWYFYFFHDNLQSFCSFAIIVFECYLLEAIRSRFKLLNKAIIKLNKSEIDAHAENLAKIHHACCDMSVDFNRMFGWQILLMMVVLVLKVLKLIDAVLSTRFTLEQFASIFSWIIYEVLGSILNFIPYYNAELNVFQDHKTYTYAVLTIQLCILIYSSIAKHLNEIENTAEDLILFGIPPVVTALANISCTYQLRIVKFSKFKSMFKKMNFLDSALKRFKRNAHVKVRIALNVVIVMCIILYDIITGILFEYDISYYRYYFNELFHIFSAFLLVLFESCLLNAFYLNMKSLNDKLVSRDFTRGRFTDIEDLLKTHNMICDCCDIFNDIFGWNIFLNCTQIVIGLLSVINIFLFNDYGLEESVVIIIWNSYITAQGVIIAKKCEQVINEGKKTAAVCYKTLNRYPNNELVRDRIFLLAQQAVARCPKFTAAGFFNVDYSMLFTFLNLITTYVIVIIQFSANKK